MEKKIIDHYYNKFQQQRGGMEQTIPGWRCPSCGVINPRLNLECNQCSFASDGMTTVNNEVVSDFNAANVLNNLKYYMPPEDTVGQYNMRNAAHILSTMGNTNSPYPQLYNQPNPILINQYDDPEILALIEQDNMMRNTLIQNDGQCNAFTNNKQRCSKRNRENSSFCQLHHNQRNKQSRLTGNTWVDPQFRF